MTDPVPPEGVRAAISAGHVREVVIFCDVCGVQDRADYTGATSEVRIVAARRHLSENAGWSITADADLCPACAGGTA